MRARGEHANSTHKGPSRLMDSNPGPARCEGTVLITVRESVIDSLSAAAKWNLAIIHLFMCLFYCHMSKCVFDKELSQQKATRGVSLMFL